MISKLNIPDVLFLTFAVVFLIANFDRIKVKKEKHWPRLWPTKELKKELRYLKRANKNKQLVNGQYKETMKTIKKELKRRNK